MQSKDLLIIKPAGALDHTQVSALEAALAHPGPETSVVLDFRNVSFIDSRLINYLISLKNRFPRDYCRVKIVNPNELVLKALEATYIAQIFEIDYPLFFRSRAETGTHKDRDGLPVRYYFI